MMPESQHAHGVQAHTVADKKVPIPFAFHLEFKRLEENVYKTLAGC